MKSNEPHKQIKGLSPVMLFAAVVIVSTILMVTDTLPFNSHRVSDLERTISYLKKELAVSDDQVEQIRPVLEAQAERERELFSDSSSVGGDRRAIGEQMMKIREETDKKIESILTSQQLEKYQELRRERMRLMNKMRNH